MSGQHLTEEVLQQYALDPAGSAREVRAHVETCRHCRTAVEAYGILMVSLAEQEAPAFEFDLAAIVLDRLTAEAACEPPVVQRIASDPGSRVLPGLRRVWLVLIALAGVAVPGWLFRKSAYFVLTDMSAAFSWLMLGAATVVLLVHSIRLYKKYRHILHLLK